MTLSPSVPHPFSFTVHPSIMPSIEALKGTLDIHEPTPNSPLTCLPGAGQGPRPRLCPHGPSREPHTSPRARRAFCGQSERLLAAPECRIVLQKLTHSALRHLGFPTACP